MSSNQQFTRDDGGGDPSPNKNLSDERPDVLFNHVGGDNHGETFLAFKYKQPNISVKTQGNFATHDVFGDMTVRQKLGEKPDEISLDGQCTVEEANKVDKLVYQEVVELISNRWSGVVHIASTSTDPIADGGGQDLDGEFLYSLNIEAVEITEGQTDKTKTEVTDVLAIEGSHRLADEEGF